MSLRCKTRWRDCVSEVQDKMGGGCVSEVQDMKTRWRVVSVRCKTRWRQGLGFGLFYFSDFSRDQMTSCQFGSWKQVLTVSLAVVPFLKYACAN